MSIADKTLRVNEVAIPIELRRQAQWVAWKLEQRDGRATKVPYRADGRGRASVTNPQTWCSFATAIGAYRTVCFDGVGFVLTATDPFVGVDLDHARDETGAPESWASDIIRSLDSYCEVSPSGRGYRIFLRAALPPDGNRRGPVEIYAHDRFLTVTGQHVLGTPDEIMDRHGQLARVHAQYVKRPTKTATGKSSHLLVSVGDRDLLIRALRAKNGGRLARLWSGDASGYGGDHSAADLALCGHLAFWTGGDPERVDRLFRRSGLMRDKWDEGHRSDGATYGAMTVERAVTGSRRATKRGAA